MTQRGDTTSSGAAAHPEPPADVPADRPRQPLLHDRVVALAAPSQTWSAPDGSIGGGVSPGIEGVFVSDVRVVAEQRLTIGGVELEHIATVPESARSIRFVALARQLDGDGADPDVRVTQLRTAHPDGVDHAMTIDSRRAQPTRAALEVQLQLDGTDMDRAKAGLGPLLGRLEPAVEGSTVRWRADQVEASLEAPGAEVHAADRTVVLRWQLEVPARGTVEVGWRVRAADADAVVRSPERPFVWRRPRIHSGDDRLERWVHRALDDLDALRLESHRAPGEVFLAAGAPWFLTLFGRDSIWAARFLLPFGTELAGGTLRVLAALQGTADDPATAEQPGKIMHELRRGTLEIPDEGVILPPLYYGTVDATPLWVCLLHDAWRWGLAADEVRALLPNLRAALAWMRDSGDSDGDGLLEYVDTMGTGLSNQGWKDSGDSVQWRDGSLAEGPIALCEVQAYAYEAAMHGADLLDAFGGEPDESADWRAWAGRLRERFHAAFWITDAAGDYPAIALDAQKRAVDTVTSNLGHLLGTGLLDAEQAALVARRLGSPELDSGFGLRTMSTDSAGYWPLSYHGGSVWTHDTAIAIAGLRAEGHDDVADSLAEGLLTAAAAFDYRMPELHAGDSAAETAAPAPYPAACRPQAWSAAAAVSVLAGRLGLKPGRPAG